MDKQAVFQEISFPRTLLGGLVAMGTSQSTNLWTTTLT